MNQDLVDILDYSLMTAALCILLAFLGVPVGGLIIIAVIIVVLIVLSVKRERDSGGPE